jgi:hypothetical protein
VEVFVKENIVMFDKLLKAAIGTVLLPVDIAKDIVTLGGNTTDRDKSYTEESLRRIAKNIDKALDD